MDDDVQDGVLAVIARESPRVVEAIKPVLEHRGASEALRSLLDVALAVAEMSGADTARFNEVLLEVAGERTRRGHGFVRPPGVEPS